MRQDGYDVINYVDDFVGVGVPSVASSAFEHLKNILQRMGLDISVKEACTSNYQGGLFRGGNRQYQQNYCYS